MAIHNITIKDSAGKSIGAISAASGVSLTGSIRLADSITDVADEHLMIRSDSSFGSESHTAVIYDNYTGSMYEKALEEFKQGQKFADLQAAIKTINGIKPTEDGTFFIHGSACTDVYTNAGSIEVIDHCTPCFTCDNVFRLKRLFEYYRIMINALKDINLYSTDVTEIRKDYLANERMIIPDACKDTLSAIDAKRLVDSINLEDYQLTLGNLLRQYITTVHLWNYAVSINNSSSKIQNTPEDPSGILIQTKRGVASCSANPATITCKITLSLSGNATYLYLPDPKTEFYPKEFGSIGENMATVLGTGLSREIVANFTAISSPGTFVITVKAMPFNAYKAAWSNDDGVVSPDTVIDWASMTPEMLVKDCEEVKRVLKEKQQSVTGEFDHDDGARLTFTEDNSLPDPPTLAAYKSSKVFPSQSSNTTMTWTIGITWTITQNGVSKSVTENYEFDVPGLRTVVNGFTRVAQFSGIGDGDDA